MKTEQFQTPIDSAAPLADDAKTTRVRRDDGEVPKRRRKASRKQASDAQTGDASKPGKAKSARRSTHRTTHYGPMGGLEFLWILRRAGIRQRHAAEALGLTTRSVQRMIERPAVPHIYVMKLERLVGGRRFYVALRDEYLETYIERMAMNPPRDAEILP